MPTASPDETREGCVVNNCPRRIHHSTVDGAATMTSAQVPDLYTVSKGSEEVHDDKGGGDTPSVKKNEESGRPSAPTPVRVESNCSDSLKPPQEGETEAVEKSESQSMSTRMSETAESGDVSRGTGDEGDEENEESGRPSAPTPVRVESNCSDSLKPPQEGETETVEKSESQSMSTRMSEAAESGDVSRGTGDEGDEECSDEAQTEDGGSITDADSVGLTTEAKQERASWKFKKLIFLSAIVAILAVIISMQLGGHPSPPPAPRKKRVDIFHEEFKKVKLGFPSQREELWKRSEIHLARHLEAKHPMEPVSMILTSGHRAERTLRCLAVRLAEALSSALNASVLQIEGAHKASQDSDLVKLNIDQDLQVAFGKNKGPVVIHRFEKLPPGSTLIFYRYCDHENSIFKEASLIFTVLLEEEEELESNMSLSDVEEMVQDHIKGKFLSSAKPAAFDVMDDDKLGGLWSRISHVVLPVAAEKHIEQHGCKS